MKERMSAYAAAGVGAEAGNCVVELMKATVGRALDVDVVGGIGGFAGMVDVSALREFQRPLLAASTDGVGTKITIARALDVHDTIGQDLAGMVVDDIAVVGARPLLVTDYIACGRVDPERIADVVRGVVRACEFVGVPPLGGETAEHPGLMVPDDYDIAGAAIGVVEADEALDPERVEVGDVVLAIASSELYSNGYSLIRRIVAKSGWLLDHDVPELGRTLGEELLEPTRLYSPLCLEVSGKVHAFSHVTSGGLVANLTRVVSVGMRAPADRSSIKVPPVFSIARELGGIARENLEDTLNMGVGMVIMLAEKEVGTAVASSAARGCAAWPVGVVSENVNTGQGAASDAGASRATGSDASRAASERIVDGTEGMHGGTVRVFGAYR